VRGRDENLALRSLVAATEAHTATLGLLIGKVDEVLTEVKGITTRLDEFHAEFATHRHGDDGEVI
jgi:hypothetical protein